jgi:transposase
VIFLTERQSHIWNAWHLCANASRVLDMARFANSMDRNDAAVPAACSWPESNGVPEGHVNCLTCLKRHMVGRAHLDLRHVTVLHAV